MISDHFVKYRLKSLYYTGINANTDLRGANGFQKLNLRKSRYLNFITGISMSVILCDYRRRIHNLRAVLISIKRLKSTDRY